MFCNMMYFMCEHFFLVKLLNFVFNLLFLNTTYLNELKSAKNNILFLKMFKKRE